MKGQPCSGGGDTTGHPKNRLPTRSKMLLLLLLVVVGVRVGHTLLAPPLPPLLEETEARETRAP